MWGRIEELIVGGKEYFNAVHFLIKNSVFHNFHFSPIEINSFFIPINSGYLPTHSLLFTIPLFHYLAAYELEDVVATLPPSVLGPRNGGPRWPDVYSLSRRLLSREHDLPILLGPPQDTRPGRPRNKV